MTFILGKNIKVGQKIKTENGWRKIKHVTKEGCVLTGGFVSFGSVIYGWKA